MAEVRVTPRFIPGARFVVAVVGGGLAGLSAALELKRLGRRLSPECRVEVRLFERSRLLGGKATSFTLDGLEVDNGQHVYLACCTAFIDFVHQITVQAPSSLLPTTVDSYGEQSAPEPSVLFLQDRFEAVLLARGKRPARLRAARLPAPWHLALALLRYRHLDPLTRLQVGRAILEARKPPYTGETFAAWLDRHHQSPAARSAFWDPFMVPALNAPLELVSAEAALFTISTAFLSDAGAARFGYARVPLARIAEAAAQMLDHVHLRTPVVALDTGDGGIESLADSVAVQGVVLEDGSRVPCDAAILAVPPGRLKQILGRPEEFGVFGLDHFQLAPIIDVHLWYDVPALGLGFAALLDSPVQWVFEKAPGYLCCSMSAAGDYVNQPRAELVELCQQELSAVLPALAGARLLRGAATRDREATFVPTPGLERPGPITTCPQLVIAGAWTDTGWPATMESAVRSGRAAARALERAMSYELRIVI